MSKKTASNNPRKGAKRLAREALISAATKLEIQDFVGGVASAVPASALSFARNPNNVLNVEVVTNTRLLPQDVKNDIFNLLEVNMKAQYEASKSEMPWDPTEKRKELFHPGSRMLLVRGKSSEICCFAHFRFEADDEDEPEVAVCYLYEIQIAKSNRSNGLGFHIMRIIEAFARHAQMPKIMLTVFKSNTTAMAFYRRKLGYSIDESSPSNFGNKGCSYEILSLSIESASPEAFAASKASLVESLVAFAAAAPAPPTQSADGAASAKDSGEASHEEQRKAGSSCAQCSASAGIDGGELKACAKCQRVVYCSRACQLQHWKAGGHKQLCKSPVAVREAAENSAIELAVGVDS